MIPDWKLEKYLTGDLPAEEMEAIKSIENSDEVFAARVRLLREDNECILKKFSFEKLSAKMDCKVAYETTPSAMGNFIFVKIAAAVVVVLGLISSIAIHYSIKPELESPMEVAMVSTGSTTRIKGFDPRMEIWKKTDVGILQVENMDLAHEGDEIQLRYSVPEKCYGLLFSMDGNGTLTVHVGNDGSAVYLEPGKMNTLPFAYKLDNAPKFEKFFLLTSKNEFTLSPENIDAVLKQEGMHVVSMTLRKAEGE